MPTIGYMEGTDPLTLTRLSASGIGTMPISNGFDNHGKFINNLSERDQVALLVGYLHKFLATQQQGFFVEDLLQACRESHIQVLVLAPETDHPLARRALATVSDIIALIEPSRLFDEAAHRLGLHPGV
jgi:hypothetical protein